MSNIRIPVNIVVLDGVKYYFCPYEQELELVDLPKEEAETSSI